MSEKTISEMVLERINNIFNHLKTMPANELSENLVELSVLHASLTEKICDFEKDYMWVWDTAREENPDMSDRKIEAIAKKSDIYLKYNKAVKLEKSLMTIIQSLKKRLNILEREQFSQTNV